MWPAQTRPAFAPMGLLSQEGLSRFSKNSADGSVIELNNFRKKRDGKRHNATSCSLTPSAGRIEKRNNLRPRPLFFLLSIEREQNSVKDIFILEESALRWYPFSTVCIRRAPVGCAFFVRLRAPPDAEDPEQIEQAGAWVVRIGLNVPSAVIGQKYPEGRIADCTFLCKRSPAGIASNFMTR